MNTTRHLVPVCLWPPPLITITFSLTYTVDSGPVVSGKHLFRCIKNALDELGHNNSEKREEQKPRRERRGGRKEIMFSGEPRMRRLVGRVASPAAATVAATVPSPGRESAVPAAAAEEPPPASAPPTPTAHPWVVRPLRHDLRWLGKVSY